MNLLTYPKPIYFRHWKDVPDEIWRHTPNFHPSTDPYLVSPDLGDFNLHMPSMLALQRLRDITRKPCVLTSGYRNPIYNALKKGAPLSMHKLVIAFDISMHNYHPPELLEQARAAGFTGFGIYLGRNFMHMDLGKPRLWFGSRHDKLVWSQM